MTTFCSSLGLARFAEPFSSSSATPILKKLQWRRTGALVGFALLLMGAPVLSHAQYQVLYSFCSVANCADGGGPLFGSLIQDASGNLYGATSVGGANNQGTVFKLDPTGHETVLYSFCSVANCVDGQSPRTGVIQDSAGNLYGTTLFGGANALGTVFKVDSTGHETVLYSFCSVANCADGRNPAAGVIQDSADNLYGTTQGGGATFNGSVFKLDPTGHETVLYSFCSVANCTDGYTPAAGVIQDSAGNLYGTTRSGGANDQGIVFKLDPTGHETVLYSFCSAANCADGSDPYAGVIQDSAGNLYGTTYLGGANNVGTLYKVDPAGHEAVIHSFCSAANCTDGGFPFAGVIQDSAGNLYGTASANTVFKVDPTGNFTALYRFCSVANCADGSGPYGGLIRDAVGNLYGTTSSGGAQSFFGTVFKIATQLVASPESLNFGNVIVGRSKKEVVILTNISSATVGIGPTTLSVTLGSQFKLEHTCPAKLRPGTHCTIAVVFTPDAGGQDVATLNIGNSLGSAIDVPITATGIQK
jgi:uncharacterized repeat protein (TIGR03803 family)